MYLNINKKMKFMQILNYALRDLMYRRIYASRNDMKGALFQESMKDSGVKLNIPPLRITVFFNIRVFVWT
jgi:hypothetical protein